eukprot:SAG22_NODE_124_length_18884_cov_34.149367_14_plen_217_part_01
MLGARAASRRPRSTNVAACLRIAPLPFRTAPLAVRSLVATLAAGGTGIRSRRFAASRGAAAPPEEAGGFGERLADGISAAIVNHPLPCVLYVLGCRYVVFGPVVYAVRTFAPAAVPAELALAYVLTRPLVKLRLPVELVVARVLAQAVPALGRVKVSALVGLMPIDLTGGAAASGAGDWVRVTRPALPGGGGGGLGGGKLRTAAARNAWRRGGGAGA